MTGKQLCDFYNISSTSPEFQQMPPCLAVLLSVKNDFERIQNRKPFVTLIDTSDKNVIHLCILMCGITTIMLCTFCSQYSRFSSLCADMVKTVCSQTKVLSVLDDFKSQSGQDAMIKRILSMNRAISVFVHQVHSEFQEFVDVAEPFVSAILQVN